MLQRRWEHDPSSAFSEGSIQRDNKEVGRDVDKHSGNLSTVRLGTDIYGHKTCADRDVKKTRSHQVFKVCNEYQDQSQNAMNEGNRRGNPSRVSLPGQQSENPLRDETLESSSPLSVPA